MIASRQYFDRNHGRHMLHNNVIENYTYGYKKPFKTGNNWSQNIEFRHNFCNNDRIDAKISQNLMQHYFPQPENLILHNLFLYFSESRKNWNQNQKNQYSARCVDPRSERVPNSWPSNFPLCPGVFFSVEQFYLKSRGI